GERRPSRASDSGRGPRRVAVEVDGGPDPAEVLSREVVAELRETVRPHAYDEAAQVLAAAVVALSDEEVEAAVRAARTAKRVAPRSAAAREVLGIALYQAGEFRAA